MVGIIHLDRYIEELRNDGLKLSFVTIAAVDHNVFRQPADIGVSLHTEDACIEIKHTLGDFDLEQSQISVSSNVVASVATAPLVGCALSGVSNDV